MKKIVLMLLVACIILCSCKSTEVIDEQVKISYNEIKALVDLDYTFTNYTHYASDMISYNQEEYVLKDTYMYFKITDPDLDTWVEWEEFCKSIYSSDLLDIRLEEIKNHITDIDSYAYVSPGGQGRPMSTDFECEIIEEKDAHALVKVIYKDLHEESLGKDIVYIYEFEYTPSGWRIKAITHDTTKAPYEMPKPFGSKEATGGDENNAFYLPCGWFFDGIPAELGILVDQDAYESWADNHNLLFKAPSSLKNYVNIYSFIAEFDIPDEDVLSALSVYLETDDKSIAISEEEMSIILSKDEVRIAEHFASPYSIVIGEKIYSPQWVYENSVDAYKNAGITKEMLKEKLSLYRDIRFSKEARLAFEEKLSDYLGEEIKLLPINEPFYMLEDEKQDFCIGEYSLDWLTSHTIQDYKEANITLWNLANLLSEMSDYKNSKEYDWIKSAYDRMLENVPFQISDEDKAKVGDYLNENGLTVSKYATLDLNSDAQPELVGWLERESNKEWGFLILHFDKDLLFIHELSYRSFYELKSDGIFNFSGGVSDHGIGKLEFTPDGYTINKIAYCQSSPDSEKISYYIEGKEASRSDFDAYKAKQDEKPYVNWITK